MGKMLGLHFYRGCSSSLMNGAHFFNTGFYLGYHFYRGRSSSLLNYTVKRVKCHIFFFLANEISTKKGKVSLILSAKVKCRALTFTGVKCHAKFQKGKMLAYHFYRGRPSTLMNKTQ